MRPDTPITRRQLLRWSHAGFLACAGLSVVLPACDWDGNFTILGYGTAPNYDPKYKTVRVPIFLNKTYHENLEFDLTQAVVQQIEQVTPMKVVAASQPADTELLGTITTTTKNLLNLNPLNENREAEITLTVELVWRDLHTGDILSQRGKKPTDTLPFEPLVQPTVGSVPGLRETAITSAPTLPTGPVAVQTPADPAQLGQPRTLTDPAQLGQPKPIDPLRAPGVAVLPPAPPAIPIKITSTANFVPEVGQSTTSAYAANVHRLAVQIVAMMEKPW